MARRPPSSRRTTMTPEPKPEGKQSSTRKTVIVTSTVFLVVITISVFIGLYFSIWKDLWSPVIQVNDDTINMDYVIRRMKYLDQSDDVLSMLTTITEEIFIRQGAPLYGIEVTQDEIDELMRDIARGDNETITESEFQTWFRNVLNETKLSEDEYRDWLLTIILADELNEYLIERIPTVAEQVHLYIIQLSSFEDTEAALARINDGEDFSEVAREVSTDEETAEKGGDTGWWPEGVLHVNLNYAAFSLEIGEVSDPILIDEDAQQYVICMVTEKQSAREITEEQLAVIEEFIFQEWLYYQWNTVDYSWISLDGGSFDDYTLQWIALQVAK